MILIHVPLYMGNNINLCPAYMGNMNSILFLIRVSLYLWDTNVIRRSLWFDPHDSRNTHISCVFVWNVFLCRITFVRMSNAYYLWLVFTLLLRGLCWVSDFWLALFDDASLLEVLWVSHFCLLAMDCHLFAIALLPFCFFHSLQYSR